MDDEIVNTTTGDVPVPTVLPQLSPDLVHANILGCQALKNRVDLKLLEWLFVLIDCVFPPRSPRGDGGVSEW